MMPPSASSLREILDRQIQILSFTRRPSTINGYRASTRSFLSFLRAAAPALTHLPDLKRDPHLLGWFAFLCEHHPPLSNRTRHNRLLLLRRLFDELTALGHPVTPHLILPADFPPLPAHLPRALSLQDDQLLQDHLRHSDTLYTHALRLLRLTGMRIGECLDLSVDCLRQIGPDLWALHIPLGKLHTERMFPADDEIRHVVARILSLRALDSAVVTPASANFLLPRSVTRATLYTRLSAVLAKAAQFAHCSIPVTAHPLRHTFASDMVRMGMSLPALMQLLGHKDIRMTMRYVQITQLDLHREYHAALGNAANPHRVPVLAAPDSSDHAGPLGISRAISATCHLMEMYRRDVNSPDLDHKLLRLSARLMAVAKELEHLGPAKK